MRLATAQQVLDLLGVPPSTGSLANAGAALDATAPIVEGLLETTLEQATWTDFFDYAVDSRRRRFEPVTFRLSSMLLDTDSPVTPNESATAMVAVSEGTTLAAADYRIDHNAGLVTVLRDVEIGYYTFAVTYTAGFPVDSTTGALKGAPEWLVRAGTVAAQHYLSLNPAFIPGKKVTAVKEISSGIRERVSAVLNPRLRGRMNLQWPSRTVRHD